MSAVADLIARRAYRRSRIARGIARYCSKNTRLRDATVIIAGHEGKDAERHLVAISRTHNRISASCPDWMIVEQQTELFFRAGAVLVLVCNAPLETVHAVADLSDGERSGPGLLSFCSCDPGAILVPDHLFIWSRGYEHYRQLARANRIEWRRRGDRIVWRGSTTGPGIIATDDPSADDPALLLRVRLCAKLKGVPDTDVKISSIVQSGNPSRDKERLTRAGIAGDFISPLAWHSLKFAIDIDGNSNAWSNFFTRLVMGCCVLKVASPSNYRQWYYFDLRPWTHYVPVKADLSDLLEQIAWCRANLDECERIAAQGQEFAMARTWETEFASGVARLCEAAGQGTLRTTLAA